MARRADRARYEAALARGLAGDLGSLLVDLERVLVETPLLELDAAGLEGVGLDDVGAGIEHRLMDALDHVGAVQDEGFVALALEPAVVLLREVEHLEGRAHAAVVDDDALANCFQVVPHANPTGYLGGAGDGLGIEHGAARGHEGELGPAAREVDPQGAPMAGVGEAQPGVRAPDRVMALAARAG